MSKFCNECGAVLFDEGATFCSACGARIGIEEPAEIEDVSQASHDNAVQEPTGNPRLVGILGMIAIALGIVFLFALSFFPGAIIALVPGMSATGIREYHVVAGILLILAGLYAVYCAMENRS